MPLYKVICRGSLVTPKGKPNIPQDGIIEMSKEEADSLPPGTVELVAKPVEMKPEPKKEK